MKKIKIFLASSAELVEDRVKIEIEIYRKCKMWYDKGLFLHLDIWEDVSTKISPTRLQDEYNRYVREADIFILLAYTKVGMYTAEEFRVAHGTFSETKKPFIFTYFKKLSSDVAPSDSLADFKKELKALNHYPFEYANKDALWIEINKELDRLELENFDRVAPHSNSQQPTQTSNITIGNQYNQGDHGTITINNK